MKVFIVDDSRLARSELKTLLQDRSDVVIVGEAGDAVSARQGILGSEPDLLLLDIHMPGEDGFALLESLDRVPAVVFVTAYDAHAVRAFDVNALDYLMKPVVQERLFQALDKVTTSTLSETGVRRSRDDRIFVREGERCWLVRLNDVRLLEVVGNYTRLFVADEHPLAARPLRHFEERLDPRLFFRVNRSQIVNLDWVRSISPSINEGFTLTLRDGSEIEVSRRQARELRGKLEL